ncbi:unnamed protein product [Rhizophagus irregularis]|nr:unnamed protein product [Rhizophagus irregularis]
MVRHRTFHLFFSPYKIKALWIRGIWRRDSQSCIYRTMTVGLTKPLWALLQKFRNKWTKGKGKSENKRERGKRRGCEFVVDLLHRFKSQSLNWMAPSDFPPPQNILISTSSSRTPKDVKYSSSTHTTSSVLSSAGASSSDT